MKQFTTIRVVTLVGALSCAAAAHAQHGGGGMGGHMGGMGGNMSRGRTPATIRPVGPQLGLSGRWWDERKTIKSLNLRSDQKQRMDDIFATNKVSLVNLLSNLQHEESALSSMSKADRQDETKVFAAINRVETARGELAKEIAHVQLQIRQQLDANQLTKLDEAIASGQ